jgi:hypothetical protein
MTADYSPIQKQDRHVKSMSPLQHRIAVNIDDVYGRERDGPAKDLQLMKHLITKLTVLAMDDCQLEGRSAHALNDADRPARS